MGPTGARTSNRLNVSPTPTTTTPRPPRCSHALGRPRGSPAGGDFYSFKGVFVLQLADFLLTPAVANSSLEPALHAQLLGLLANSSDAAWALRATPPWATQPLDACADPAQAHLESGPPKFPMYWSFLAADATGEATTASAASSAAGGPAAPGAGAPTAESGLAGPKIVCRDARTQISALGLFVAHARVAAAEAPEAHSP